ncbi:transmembrane protein 104 [Erpetoichthys calabaricus]|uniref:Transmembrane protein 104 n=1 Tax=Erpetoichthys calabaricus TaxID=27687 RepID=A0A8C4TK37_ERPCA|nr:transmembrane protein 104 [Erpetoichthys calabaricus]
MAGGITDTGELYSPSVGLVYMFNLIVGTGALTMPKAFATAGWVVSLVLISVLAFMSYITTTFVIEAMAAANAQLRWKRRENQKVEDGDSSSEISDDEVLVRDRYDRSETRPILSVQRVSNIDHFDIVERVEMGQMASLFFNKVGVNLFYICLIVYLYGDLAIYAAAVPMSLMEVACGNLSCSAGSSLKYNDTEVCWGHVKRQDAYRIFLAVFTLLLGPFTFFNVQKTKYLQIGTSLMRWIAFTTMIILALIRIGKGKAEGHPPAAVLLGVPNLFGVCVYSFMCQHSLPSVVTPISDKRRVSALVLLDYTLILSFYSLLSFTAIFCFDNGVLKDMYTLNFTDNCDVIGVAFLRYFLGLFPVFTISTNFPIIAVTLRNNWKTLFHRGGTYPWVVDRVVFPLITLVPPIIVAFCTHDLETLVGITGAYAGTGIQYIIPACLVYFGRKDLGLTYGDAVNNKHRSPFHHVFWVWFVLIWAGSCLMFVTANIVLTETKH